MFRNLHILYPSLTILLGLITGITPVILWRDHVFLLIALSLFSVSMLSGAIVFKRKTISFFLFSTIGLLLSIYYLCPSSGNYIRIVKRNNCGAVIKVIVIDRRCTGETLDWLPNPRLLKCEISKVRFTENDSWRSVNGRIVVRLTRYTQPVNYGDRLILDGAFNEPAPAFFRGDFNFRNYLLARGIDKVFNATKMQIVGSSTGFNLIGLTRNLLGFRNLLIGCLTDKISDVEEKRILAALFFGCRQGLSGKDRRAFIRSGTVHLFAISGLHVGMLALILFQLFRLVPFRMRYILVPCLLFLYVSTIGFQPSAVRALLMISIWSIHRSFLLPSNPLNIVFLSASIILLINPFSLLDIGFQYSFVISGFLVHSWGKTRGWLEMLNEKLRWQPTKCLTRFDMFSYHAVNRIICSVVSVIVAFLTSSGITLFYRGLYIPMAIVANLILLPFVWLLFIISAAKLTCGQITFIGQTLGNLIHGLLEFINGVCYYIASYGGTCFIGVCPLWTLPVFYCALLLFINATGKKLFLNSALVICGIMVFWHVRYSFAPGEVVVFHGGDSQTPAVLVCPPTSKQAFLINAPSPEIGSLISNYLAVRGIDELNSLIIQKTRKDCCAGGYRICNGCDVKQLVIPEGYRRSYYAKSLVRNAVESQVNVIVMDSEKKTDYDTFTCNLPLLNVKDTGNFFNAVINTPLIKHEIQIQIAESPAGIKNIQIILPYGKNYFLELENRSTVRMEKFDMTPNDSPD